MNGLISVNNIVTLPEKARISPLDRGFLFSDQVFEALVSFGHTILDISHHLQRLRDSAEEFDIKIPWSDEELKFELQHLVEQVNAPKINLRLVVTRGTGMGLNIPTAMTPNKIIYATPARLEDPKIYNTGIGLKRKRLPYVDRGAHPKTGNYLRSILGLRDAKAEGYDDVVWSNSEGELTEASTANIFLIGRIGDEVEICTPSISSGILEGITRATIIRLLTNAGIRVSQEIVFIDELPRFDEAFVCSTIRGLVPINRIDKHILHSCRPTAVFRKIESLFLTWIQSQLGQRVDWNTGSPLGD
jgi:branched-subunit amino acid aminotransferase/4-amino-4-deoxychorismate lyase